MVHYEITLFLSKIIGITFLVFGAAILLNIRIYTSIAKKITENPLLLFLLGSVDLILGLLLILTHNDWVYSWTVLVTIAGWLFAARGVLRLVFPLVVMKAAGKIGRHMKSVLCGSALFVLVYGAVLLYFSMFAG